METQTTLDAVALANEIIRMEAALKQMKEQLQSHVKLHGPVETDELIFDYFPSVSWEFSPEAKKEMCIHIAIEGINPFSLLNFGSTGIKKLGWSEDALKNFGTPKVSKSFRSKKKE